MRLHQALVLILLAAPGVARAEERVDLPTRPDVTETVFLSVVPAAARSVILFTGGAGVVSGGRGNFLLRSADRFVAAGFNVAIPEAPSDHASGISDGFRESAEHATDIAAVIALLQQKSAAPVWLVGTSRGTISAASVAARIGPPRVAGLVLTSSIWRALDSVPLDQIRVPTLVVHNRDDACPESPYSSASSGLAALRAAPAKEFIPVSGGTSKSVPCQALSPHGYYGIEYQVVPLIVDWIKAH